LECGSLGYVPISDFEAIAKVAFLIVVLFVWAVTMIKISVCLMLLRIKRQSKPWFIGLWTMIAVLFCIAVTVTVLYLVMCNPIQANWQLKYIVEPDACWSIDRFINFTYGFSSKLECSFHTEDDRMLTATQPFSCSPMLSVRFSLLFSSTGYSVLCVRKQHSHF